MGSRGGATRTGRIITYQFQAARIYNVALTVTDAAGATATSRTNVTVTAAAKPTVTVAFTPAAPAAGQPVVFTATPTVAANHRVVGIDWNFGDGNATTTTGNSVQKNYSSAATYIVVATVRDDLGQSGSATTTVTVGTGITFLSPAFTVSPTPVRPNASTIFNASGITTTGGATIKRWEWDFGDGSTADEGDEITTHSFSASEDKTFVVRLKVTDSAGRTATTSRDISVDVP